MVTLLVREITGIQKGLEDLILEEIIFPRMRDSLLVDFKTGNIYYDDPYVERITNFVSYSNQSDIKLPKLAVDETYSLANNYLDRKIINMGKGIQGNNDMLKKLGTIFAGVGLIGLCFSQYNLAVIGFAATIGSFLGVMNNNKVQECLKPEIPQYKKMQEIATLFYINNLFCQENFKNRIRNQIAKLEAA